jgi:hypothetical protein
MLRKALLGVAVLAICFSGMAAEDGGEAKPKRTRKSRGRTPRVRLVAPKPLVNSCPVLVRLGLTEEQLGKVKPLDEELAKKFQELKTEAGKDRKKQAEAATKLKELVEEARKKVLELLTEEQKKKYEEGMKVLETFKTGMTEARTAYNAARKAAGKDKAKRTAAVKAYRAKQKELTTTRNKGLDEKVGKAPEGWGKPQPRKAPAKKKAKKAPKDEGGEALFKADL